MEIRIKKLTILAVALVVIGALLRIIPHTANFAPIGAIALFGGAILTWRIALWLPLVIMVLSDLIIGIHPLVGFTWGGFMLIALFGMLLKEKRNLIRIPLGAVGSALVFFIISNLGVWIEGKLYPHTWQGFIDCYVMALPFLRSSFVADLSYSILFFGMYALAGQKLKGDLLLTLPHYTSKKETKA